MSVRIFSLLLESIFFVLIGSALLRAYMTWLRVPQIGQPARFAAAVTNFLVKPIQCLLPKSTLRSRFDAASFFAATVLALTYALLWLAVVGAWQHVVSNWATVVPMVAVKMMVRVTLQSLMLLVLLYTVLAWTQAGSALVSTLSRLVEPLLGALRRVLPVVGGVDLSALVLLLLLQIGMIVFV